MENKDYSERMASLEATQKSILEMLRLQAEAQRETRDEIRQFRSGLFNIINPLVHDLGKTRGELDIVKAWVQKSKSWAPAVGIGSAGGIATFIWNSIKSLWADGG